MAKKVILDTLDIEESAENLEGKTPEIEEGGDKPPVKWFASRWFRLTSLLLAVLICGAGLFSYWRIAAKKTGPQAALKKASQTALPSLGKNMELVSDFLIPLKDNKGHDRIILCDLVVELNAGHQPIFRKNVVGVRNIIYDKATKNTSLLLIKRGNMNILRKEIGDELGNLLGNGVIKAVYFTKFIVL